MVGIPCSLFISDKVIAICRPGVEPGLFIGRVFLACPGLAGLQHGPPGQAVQTGRIVESEEEEERGECIPLAQRPPSSPLLVGCDGCAGGDRWLYARCETARPGRAGREPNSGPRSNSEPPSPPAGSSSGTYSKGNLCIDSGLLMVFFTPPYPRSPRC